MSSVERAGVESVHRACDLLSAFVDQHAVYGLAELATRVSMSKPSAHRILTTLESRGLVRRVGRGLYASQVTISRAIGPKIGYATMGEAVPFAAEITAGLMAAAAKRGVQLVILDNQQTPKRAVENAQHFVDVGVEAVIELQNCSQAADTISTLLRKQNIPLVAIDIPHPRAHYFGANNPVAGHIAGRYLSSWAQSKWNDHVDEVMLIGIPKSGPLPNSRLLASLLTIREHYPEVSDGQVRHLSGNGLTDQTYEVVRTVLKRNKAKHILVSAINDESGIGALRAFDDMGRSDTCAIVGQNGSFLARSELFKSQSAFVGSVGYFPERYGDRLVSLVIDLIEKKNRRRAEFVEHILLTRDNIREHYLQP